jgi:hypothetical protein
VSISPCVLGKSLAWEKPNTSHPAASNPYEASLCQETNYSLERFFACFPPFGS